jgi:hypothetical protein
MRVRLVRTTVAEPQDERTTTAPDIARLPRAVHLALHGRLAVAMRVRLVRTTVAEPQDERTTTAPDIARLPCAGHLALHGLLAVAMRVRLGGDKNR